MPLPPPRTGESDNLHVHRGVSYQGTLGDPEKIVWSSIKHLCVPDVIEFMLEHTAGLKNKRRREAAAKNVKLYIQQAAEFYDAASFAKSNTAPLFYYYAFLNLAKARCEIHQPRFHRTQESYGHGVSWRPSPKYLVRMETESISITTRGVWHVLWEALVGTACPARNPTQLRIRDLFSFCPETSIENELAFPGGFLKLIELVEPQMVMDRDKDEVWIRFSVYRSDLKLFGISRPKLLEIITYAGSPYHQVKSPDKDLWTFELAHGKKFASKKIGFDVLEEEIRKLNLFVTMEFDKLSYHLADQRRLPLLLPQLIVLYSLIFWLGSLVRYDPHSVESLQDSEHWILIDGFMNQSRIWLLELFDWEFYKTETTLRRVR